MQAKDDFEKRRFILSAAKQALLEKRLKSGQAGLPVTIPKRPEAMTAEAPASFSQQRLWFLDQLEPGKATYNISEAYHLQGPLDHTALEKSFHEIGRRHEALRTTFDSVEGNPIQRISPVSSLELQIVSVTHLPLAMREQEAQRLLDEAVQQPFNLLQGPLMRPLLVQLAPQEHLLLLSLHHILSDGWSTAIIIRELTTLYTAFRAGQPSPLPESPIQYADYAVWQRERLKDDDLVQHLSYWKQQLANSPALLELPGDWPRPARQSYQGGEVPFAFPRTLLEQLKRLGLREGASLFMVLVAAYKVLLCRYSQQEDLLIGTPIANRTHPEVENLVGLFANTLVLRTNLAGNPTFREALKRVRTMLLEAYDHQEIPFEQIVEAIHPERSLSHNPLFQVLFILQNGLRGKMGLTDIDLIPIPVHRGIAPFDLTFDISETPEGLRGSLHYNKDIFEQETVVRFIEHYRILLEGIVIQPEQHIHELPLLTPEEYHLLQIRWNQTKNNYPRDEHILNLFETQVKQTPHATALLSEKQRLSYHELNGLANRIAQHLQDVGVSSETPVAVLDERGSSLLLALLGIFKAGGAYLPLDPLHPVSRLRQVLARSAVGLILTTTPWLPVLHNVLEDWPSATPPAIYNLDTWLAEGPSVENILNPVHPHQLAYMIYTSGSTGLPKGAMVEHGGMLNHLQNKISELSLTAADTVAQTASQCFDISIWQMLAPLLVGGVVHILPDPVTHDPARLLEQVDAQKITVLQVVPSMLGAMLDILEEMGNARPRLNTLRWVVPTGEALPPELCRRWFTLFPDIPLVNAYGPTEASDDVAHYVITQPPSETTLHVPIGRELANNHLYVLGRYLGLLPERGRGELYIGGQGVGRGYWGDAARTAEVFLPDPWSMEPGARMYKTGDVVRYLPDGNIEFLGRSDHQIKLRGFRIELGEIEAALRSHEDICKSVVAIRADQKGGQRLVAYLVPIQQPGPTSQQMRSYLSERLPDYMLPSAFVLLDELPLTANGKIDRKALPDPDPTQNESGQVYVAPRTVLEEVLVNMWSDLLEIEQIGIHDNFFALGGHSLLATRFLSRLRAFLQAELSLRAFFENPTVASLAEALQPDEAERERLEEISQLLLSIAHLSEEDASALLAEE